jgi:hypothetical protein
MHGIARSEHRRVSDAWINATSRERGEALRELLLLGDRLPGRPRAERLRYPRIASR